MDGQHRGRRERGTVGGNLEDELVQEVAFAAVNGIDPLYYLRATTFERIVLSKVAERADRFLLEREARLASVIRNQIGELFKGT